MKLSHNVLSCFAGICCGVTIGVFTSPIVGITAAGLITLALILVPRQPKGGQENELVGKLT